MFERINKKGLLAMMLVFLLGWFSNSVSSIIQQSPIKQLAATSLAPTVKELPSPGDWIKQDQIKVYDNKVVIYVDEPQWATFTNTNSMDPVIDETAHAVEIVPKKPEAINPGDIISYESPYASGTIIHRVVRTGYDDQGWYAVVKGDNLPNPDPGKVRFSQVKRVLVAIIY